MKNFSVLFLSVMTLGILIPAYGQGTNVFNCASGFTSSGACGVGSGQNFNLVGNYSSLSGSQVELIEGGITHVGATLIYATAVNVQAFTTTFTFVPNGQNIAFMIQNSNNNPGYDGTDFSGGAGCESGFYQAFGTPTTGAPPNNVFALEFDSYSYLNSSETFTYSSAQIYQMAQSPCNPNDSGPNYWLTNKISTSPVPLTSPASTQGSTTGDTYSATISYDGSNFNVCLIDTTLANGTCNGTGTSGTGTYFQQSWANVNIPSMVDGNTALICLTGATGTVIGDYPLYVDSLVYTVDSAPSTPSLSSFTTTTAAGANGNYAASPTFSPPSGTYSSTQSVTLSSSTSGNNICYITASSLTSTTLMPWPNSEGGCIVGTAYTGAISVSSSTTIYAVAGTTYTGVPGAVTSAAYTITSAPPTVSTPTFSPAAGTYASAQSVTISDTTSGAAIYYTTNGTTPTTSSTRYTGPITVSSTETLEAIAADTGDTNSAVSSAAYTITSTPPTVSTPTFSPAEGAYTSAQSVTISDATSGAAIYYTTNGTTPTTSSTQYTGPITVSSTETLEAIAADTGDTNSAVASATYTINSQPNFLLTASSPSLTVNAGGQETLMLTLTPENGFNSPVSLACSGLPSGVTCDFEQQTVTVSGGAVATQLTISTNALASASQRESRPFFPLTALATIVCLFGWRKRRGAYHWLLLTVAYASLALLAGCGGIVRSFVPATSTVTVTATSGTMQQNVQIVLTVD
jgi:Chitobiase/beta-hexosaminidase C-terminal domain